MKYYLIQKVHWLFNSFITNMLNRKLNGFFAYVLLVAVPFTSCKIEPCKHQNIYENCSYYQIEWSEGFRQDFENIYDYKIEGNCATIKEAEVCFMCGSVIGFTQRQICGSFRVRSHTYCH